MHFRRDEKFFLVQIFFYCLDYVSRLQKNCSEYSGKLKHASAMDSVLKLSFKKIMRNRGMFRRCSPIIYTCLPPEIHPHGQNATIIQEIINIIASIMVYSLSKSQSYSRPNMKSFGAFLEMARVYNQSRLRTRCLERLPQGSPGWHKGQTVGFSTDLTLAAT